MNWLANLFIGLIVYPDKKTRRTIGYCIKSVKEQTVIIAIVFTQPTREKRRNNAGRRVDRGGGCRSDKTAWRRICERAQAPSTSLSSCVGSNLLPHYLAVLILGVVNHPRSAASGAASAVALPGMQYSWLLPPKLMASQELYVPYSSFDLV